ncbi:DsrE family protein [Haloferax sp. S1W]|uniref:DsrE family protein n=1 Tax=Haloferax sp. S1W TaxID=3377110 RepID=UPI0037C97F37
MNVTFHVSSGDVNDWKHALSNARNLLADETVETDAVTFLANGDAVYLLVEGAPVRDRVEALLEDGVRCCACRNSLQNRDIEPSSLVDEVVVVPSGVGELAKRQTAGDVYLKVP